MKLFNNLASSIANNLTRNAFCIQGVFYSYESLAIRITQIRVAIEESFDEGENNIGLVANDDIETYATIIALWLEGKSYVPINPALPLNRNINIINQVGINSIIDSSDEPLFSEYKIIYSKKLKGDTINLAPKDVSDQDMAYILFTSGSTGYPKGVPISRLGLNAFVDEFLELNKGFTNDDRWLQMFELTFDLSIVCFLFPLLSGACVYTVPKDQMKYTYIFELIETYSLTVVLMVPSVLQLVRHYLNELSYPEIKYSIFCGEPLLIDLIEEWSRCIPNAKIINIYGPTECTIVCSQYTYNRNTENKIYNGILSIGRAMNDTRLAIVDIDNVHQLVGPYEKGELCLSSERVMKGYWGDEALSSLQFIDLNDNSKTKRFYKTGDICFMDHESNYFYLGRMDSQIKVQGHRVELLEIEFHVKAYLKGYNAVTIPLKNDNGFVEIGLIIEAAPFETSSLLSSLNGTLPGYMIPTKIHFIQMLPLNVNGKIDRKALAQYF